MKLWKTFKPLLFGIQEIFDFRRNLEQREIIDSLAIVDIFDFHENLEMCKIQNIFEKHSGIRGNRFHLWESRSMQDFGLRAIWDSLEKRHIIDFIGIQEILDITDFLGI